MSTGAQSAGLMAGEVLTSVTSMRRAAVGNDVDSLHGGADSTCLLRQLGDRCRLYERRLSASKSVEGAAGVRDRLAIHCPCDSELRSLDVHIHQGLPHLAAIPSELSHQDTLQKSSLLRERRQQRTSVCIPGESLFLKINSCLHVPHLVTCSRGCCLSSVGLGH